MLISGHVLQFLFSKWGLSTSTGLKAKINIFLHAGDPLQVRNNDLPINIKLGHIDINLSKKSRHLIVVLNQSLTLMCQIATVKKKAIESLINIAKVSKFIDRESKLQNVLLKYLVKWTAKNKFSRSSNSFEYRCEYHCKFAYVYSQ